MIATVTLNPAIDYTVEIESDPAPDAILRTGAYTYDPGGKGINVAEHLDAMGIETIATGLVGGELGTMLTTLLDRRGIPLDFVTINGQTRLNTTILSPDGERKINQTGPRVSASTVTAVEERLLEIEPATVVIGGSLPQGVGIEAIERIAAAGEWETVVDVGGEVLTGLEGTYALCAPNEMELATATGRRIETVSDVAVAAESLLDAGFRAVVVTRGADGAVLADEAGVVPRSAPVVDVVDTVGAGDAFLAGFLAAQAAGAERTAALERGIATAALSVQTRGTGAPAALADRD